MRDMVFVSHANPEDNEFALWLSCRLAAEGYPVWCDLVHLVGGERFWDTIEDVIREQAAKFVFVLSHSSNSKTGPTNELSVALAAAASHSLQDFVIPIRIDNLPFRDINIRINQLNAIDASQNWADALSKLMKKFQVDGVPRDWSITPSTVRAAWQQAFEAEREPLREPETLTSNWFRIRLPSAIYVHSWASLTAPPDPSRLACVPYEQGVVSFATARELFPGAERGVSTRSISTDTFLTDDRLVDARTARRLVVHLVRMAFDDAMKSRGLRQYSLSNRITCHYFPKDLIPKDTIWYARVGGKQSHKAVVGYKTVSGTQRFWHFAIEARPSLTPFPHFVLRTHVLFSYDGAEIPNDPRMQHSARRKQCKDWWNAQWRDLLTATAAWLADADGTIRLPISQGRAIEVSALPEMFVSPLSYVDPENRAHDDEEEATVLDDEPEEDEEDDE